MYKILDVVNGNYFENCFNTEDIDLMVETIEEAEVIIEQEIWIDRGNHFWSYEKSQWVDIGDPKLIRERSEFEIVEV